MTKNTESKPIPKFQDDDLQSLLNEDDSQTQKQLAASLNVTQAAISQRLHKMGKVQKEGKWVPYELTERQKENEKRKTKTEKQRVKF